MKILFLTTLFKMTWEERKRKQTIIILVIGVILMAAVGVLAIRKAAAERETAVEEYQSDLANYEINLEEMRNSLTAHQENLVTAQEQYDAQRKYCEESIYMRMDGNAFYQGDIRYTITTSANLGYLNSALATYINGSAFRKSLSDQLGGVDDAYLKDVIIGAASNNIFLVTVYHYDEEKADQLLELADKTLRDQVPALAATQGEFTLTVLDRSVSKKADLAVVNAQNGALNNLRTYINVLADAKNAVSNNQQDLDNYQANNYPKEVTSLSRKDKVIKESVYLIMGIILGVCLLLGRTFLRVMLGKTISNTDYFVSLDLPVLGDYRGKTEAELVSEKIGRQINLYVIHSQAKKIYLNDMSVGRFAGAFVEQYQKCLDENSAIISCPGSEETVEAIQRDMVKSGNVLFAVRFGETTYENFMEFYRICKQFGLKVIGVILVR